LRQATLARAFDVDVGEITAAEVKAMYPHVKVGDVTCAVHLPARRPMRSRQHRHGAGQGRTDAGAQIIEGVKVTAVTDDGKRHRRRLGAGGETGHIAPTSSSIAAACGAATLPRGRA
jgi:glycine/D-amino acid oxidase-like deaminating enzyme